MFRQLLTAAVLFAAMQFCAGCVGQSKSLVRAQSVSRLEAEKIVQVTMLHGQVVRFDRNGARYYERYKNHAEVIIGRTEAGDGVVIPVERVQEALVERIVDENSSADVFPAVIIAGFLVASVVNGSQR
ncbi:MAG: hypothetical protein ACREOO_06820 [bacterium]